MDWSREYIDMMDNYSSYAECGSNFTDLITHTMYYGVLSSPYTAETILLAVL